MLGRRKKFNSALKTGGNSTVDCATASSSVSITGFTGFSGFRTAGAMPVGSAITAGAASAPAGVYILGTGDLDGVWRYGCFTA